MDFNGNIKFFPAGSGELQNAAVERLSAAPGTNLFNGRLYYNTGDVTSTDRGIWQYRNATWERIALMTEIQPLDAALTSIAGLTYTSDKIIYTTAADTFATTSITSLARTLLADTTTTGAQSTLGLVIGTNVQAYSAVLGYLTATGAGANTVPYYDTNTSAARFTITSFAITMLDDPNETTLRSTIGLVAGGAGDIWVEKAGDTMTGSLNMGTNPVLSSAVPGGPTELTNKLYVDGLVNGLPWKNEAVVTTEAALPTYTATGAGSTKTLTATANGAFTGVTVDGFSAFVINDRILLRHGAAGADNGIYYLFDMGSAGSPWILKRTEDADTIQDLSTATLTVRNGTVNKGVPFTCNNVDTDTLETTTITFVQQNSASSITAGVGLVKTGNVLDVNLGAGIVQLPTDEVGIDLFDSVNGAIILTGTGTDRITTTAAKLHLLLDGSTLTQGATGLKVADAGITGTQLNASVAGSGLAGGGGSALSVNVDASTIEISADTLQVKALGITNAHISATAAIAFSKLASLSSGTALIGSAGNVATQSAVYYIYSAQNATTSHTVNHALNQQFVTFKVYNSSNVEIGVNSATLTDANNLTITLGSAQAIKVVVCAIPGVSVTSVNNV